MTKSSKKSSVTHTAALKEGLSRREDALSTPPQPLKTTGKGYFVVGDLHGNVLKAIYGLVQAHVIEPLSAEQWKELYEAYQAYDTESGHVISSPNRDNCNKITTLINGLALTPSSKEDPKLIFLGDDLCDRGKNDYFFLWLLKHLQREGLPDKRIEIIQSNHTAEFCLAMEKASKEHAKDSDVVPQLSSRVFSAPTKSAGLMRSMLGVNTLLRRKIIFFPDLEKLYQGYKSHQRLLSYTLSENNGITVYSHAPIDREVISHVAHRLRVLYWDKTAEDLARTIERINAAYQKQLAQGGLTNLVSHGVLGRNASERYCVRSTYSPLEFMWWNRDLVRQETDVAQPKYPWCHIHGHVCNTDAPSTWPNSLDSNFGKASASFDQPTENPVYWTTGRQLAELPAQAHALSPKAAVTARPAKDAYRVAPTGDKPNGGENDHAEQQLELAERLLRSYRLRLWIQLVLFPFYEVQTICDKLRSLKAALRYSNQYDPASSCMLLRRWCQDVDTSLTLGRSSSRFAFFTDNLCPRYDEDQTEGLKLLGPIMCVLTAEAGQLPQLNCSFIDWLAEVLHYFSGACCCASHQPG